MDQYDVEMQTADMVLKVKMNNHMKLFMHFQEDGYLLTFTYNCKQETGCSVSCYLLRMGYMSSTFLLYTSGGNLA